MSNSWPVSQFSWQQVQEYLRQGWHLYELGTNRVITIERRGTPPQQVAVLWKNWDEGIESSNGNPDKPFQYWTSWFLTLGDQPVFGAYKQQWYLSDTQLTRRPV